MKKLLIFLALFVPAICAAQGFRFGSTVTQQGTIGAATNAVVLPTSPHVNVCIRPANAVPCTNRATTYTDATQFSGATPQAQINSAVSDLGSTPGLVMIPGNMAANTSSPSTPPYNVALWDHRFTNDPGTNEGVFPQAHSHWLLDFHAGANISGIDTTNFGGHNGFSITGFADAGGTSGLNAQANVISLVAYMTRAAASNRPVWAANFNTTYQSAGSNSSAIGLEIDLNNSGASDDTNKFGIGLDILSGGGVTGKKAGIALQIGNSTGGGGADAWERAISVNNYVEAGMKMAAGAARTADIYIVPPANDTAKAIVLRNTTDVATVFSVDDSGNVTSPLVNSGIFQSSTANQAATGIVRLASTDTVCWRNNANSADICISKNASDQILLNGTPGTQTIASGTAAMTTALIAAGACGTTVTVSATGALTTDRIEDAFNAAVGANPGVLILQKWVTANNVNFAYCNPTAAGVTPSAATLNWGIVR